MKSIYNILVLWMAVYMVLPTMASGQTVNCANNNAYPKEVARALSQAGENRLGLEALLKKYRSSGDADKYRACCFLIAGMADKMQQGRVISRDKRLDSLCTAFDKAYYGLIKGTTPLQQETNPLHKNLGDSSRASAKRVAQMRLEEPQLEARFLPDISNISSDFVERQIEHAFALRKSSPLLRKMPFGDFMEYVLAYRVLPEYPLVTEPKRLYDVFGKYLMADTAKSVVRVAQRFNRATWWLRRYGGQYPFNSTIGWQEMFFSQGFHDCVDLANYGALIFRSCGWPAAIDYNIAYKTFSGRHFMVTVPNAEYTTWLSFNPETEIPASPEGHFDQCLNMYRDMFERQPDNPFGMRADGEPLPYELASPGIKDVSSFYTSTTKLEIPVSQQVPQGYNLVYLASFCGKGGWRPATWGRINRKTGKAVFHNVVADNIYLPVYATSDSDTKPFGKPFKIGKAKNKYGGIVTPSSTIFTYISVNTTGEEKVAVDLKRKYPRKPSMVKLAQRAIGTFVIASDSLNFRHADTLAIISDAPTGYWQDMALDTKRPYRYYRICAPKHDPHLMLAEIQFLARRSLGYTSVIEASATDGSQTPDSLWVRVMDEPLEKCSWKAEYDGKVTTAPDRWPDVTLKLTTPHLIENLRFVVKNADNGVKAGHFYCLREWTGQGWKDIWNGMPKKDILPTMQLRVGGMYWLSDLSEGTEEMPFIVGKDGSVDFPHSYLLK